MKKQFVLVALVSAIIFAGCSKDPAPSAPAEPIPVSNALTIDFSNTGLSLAAADSASIVWRRSNNDYVKRQSFTKGNAKFIADLTGLAAGDYKTEITIYAKLPGDASSYRFGLLKTITVAQQPTAIHIAAPKNNYQDEWMKRAVVHDIHGLVTAVLPMDPRDAYYEVTMLHATWKLSSLQRTVLYDNAVMARQEHKKNITGVSAFAEYAAFTNLVQQMAGQEWTKAAFNLSLENDAGNYVYVDYAFFK